MRLLVGTLEFFLAKTDSRIELHQITASPETAPELLDHLLRTTTRLSKNAEEALRFGEFVGRSWLSIARSKGVPI